MFFFLLLFIFGSGWWSTSFNTNWQRNENRNNRLPGRPLVALGSEVVEDRGTGNTVGSTGRDGEVREEEGEGESFPEANSDRVNGKEASKTTLATETEGQRSWWPISAENAPRSTFDDDIKSNRGILSFV
ncbi:hypothetical protein EDB86DRAFT_2835913 [Lactarius hatsudake]|nr:hypothetical protein EDB86DRAFT_2835913 [Lactarius hatsudake]